MIHICYSLELLIVWVQFRLLQFSVRCHLSTGSCVLEVLQIYVFEKARVWLSRRCRLRVAYTYLTCYFRCISLRWVFQLCHTVTTCSIICWIRNFPFFFLKQFHDEHETWQWMCGVQAMIVRSEQHVAIHQQYQESLQATVDWLSQMKDKLSLCSDSTGDRTTIQNKLERLQVGGKLGMELPCVSQAGGTPH